MKRHLIRITVRGKLILIVAALIAVITTFIYIYFPMKLENILTESLRTSAQQVTRTVAYGATPALFFEDREALQEIFTALRHHEELLSLRIFSADSTIFSEYRCDTGSGLVHESDHSPETQSECLTLVQEMEYDNRRIGHLQACFSLEGLQAEVQHTRYRTLLICLILFVFGVLAIALLSRIITTPLKCMVRTVEKIIAGNLEERANIRGNDEIGFLAKEFDNMMDRLASAYQKLDELNQKLEIRVESRTAALRLTNAQLKSELNERKKIEKELSAERLRLMTMLGKISEAVIITDTENRISTINRVAAELTGWDEINAIGKPIGDILKLPPSGDNGKTVQTIQEYIREQTGEDSGMLTILDTKSQARRLKITIVPIRTLYGEKSGTVFIFRLAHRAADAGMSDLKEYQA